MRKLHRLLALGTIIAPLAAAPAFAQAPQGTPTCPPGTQLVPPSRDGAGNLIAAYCAEDPKGRALTTLTPADVSDPQAQPSEGGPGQFVPRTR